MLLWAQIQATENEIGTLYTFVFIYLHVYTIIYMISCIYFVSVTHLYREKAFCPIPECNCGLLEPSYHSNLPSALKIPYPTSFS